MKTMKAIVYNRFGGPEVLENAEIEKPVPKPEEILVKVKAAGVNYGDLLARNFKNTPFSDFNMPYIFYLIARISFGLNVPKRKVLGSIFSGVVVATGKHATKFQPGEQVFAYLGEKMGAYAEYVVLKEKEIVASKPLNMSFEEAATVPYGAIMALNLLKTGKLKKDQHILIYGASGGIGSAAVQLAKQYFGAKVTGVCGTASVDSVRKLGADQVIDYKTEAVKKITERFDLVLDVLGKGDFNTFKPLLKAKGSYLSASFKGKKLRQMIVTGLKGGKRMVCAIALPKPEDLVTVRELVDAGKFHTILDKVYPMEKAAEAHRHAESGNRKGHVVIAIDED